MDETLLREVGKMQPELALIRQDIHAHPETAMEEVRTAALVANKLKEWGITVTEAVGRLGVVGVLKSTVSGSHSIGLRADMDALALVENNDVPYVSTTQGIMHACGHDGHTTMLLGAAKYLAEHRDSFCGTVYFIFQPAEEKLDGAITMIEDKLFDRFSMDAVYGLHNLPNLDIGHFAIRPGPMMAAADTWVANFRGTGGHGAMPHLATDITIVLSQFLSSLQTIVSRNISATDSAVVSVGAIQSGSFGSLNILPAEVRVGGTTRSFTKEVRDTIERRITELAHGVAQNFGCTAEVQYIREGTALVNHPEYTERAIKAAESLVGKQNVNGDVTPTMGGEDFASMLEQRPGAYIIMGNGKQCGKLHSPTYNFNDDAIPFGTSYFIKLVQQELQQ